MIETKEILVEGSDYLESLTKLIGKPIKDIHGYLSMEFDSPVFKMSRVVFEDGTQLGCEGEHDFPYLVEWDKQPNYDDETLERLHKEANPQD